MKKVLLILACGIAAQLSLSLIHISEPTRQAEISYAVFCLKKKKKKNIKRPKFTTNKAIKTKHKRSIMSTNTIKEVKRDLRN